MRIVYETDPVAAPADYKLKGGGTFAGGFFRFVLRLYEPGEEVPTSHQPASPVAKWRRTSLATDGTLHVPPPPNAEGKIATVVVPRLVIDALPEDGRLFVQWELTRTGARL